MATVGGLRDMQGTSNSLEIEDLGRFAVDQHNKKQNAMLQYGKVLTAKQQVVAGTMYHLTLEAQDGDKKKVYEAKVWEKPWLKFKELTEFKEVGEAAASS
ncbi:Cysteine proteinase inhibitor [Melia azedarach]|uniref:Cysteine proteinase inhibitor n=1 Tax=Melia azedarach TaxID=155640 RepID=A0ACC1YL87_MELAZ|nr:Cysteine proteinase inhibitor [Melia azedarach]